MLFFNRKKKSPAGTPDPKFEADFNKNAHDYSFASKYIGARIFTNEYLARYPDHAHIKRPLTGELSLVAVFDFPHGVMNIKPEAAAQWNRTEDELIEAGRINSRVKYRSKIVTEQLGGEKVYVIEGDHLFVTNGVLDIQFFDIPTSPHGWIVGIPHRHAVLVYPITNLEAVRILPGFVYVLQSMHREGPGPISDSLFWLKEGRLTKLEYQLEGTQFKFHPPAEFAEVIRHLT